MRTYADGLEEGIKIGRVERRQSFMMSVVETLTRQVTFLWIAAIFSLWWIPESAPDISTALRVNIAYVTLSFGWGVIVRRLFTKV
jgi:hypothetical protein